MELVEIMKSVLMPSFRQQGLPFGRTIQRRKFFLTDIAIGHYLDRSMM